MNVSDRVAGMPISRFFLSGKLFSKCGHCLTLAKIIDKIIILTRKVNSNLFMGLQFVVPPLGGGNSDQSPVCG